MLEKAGQRCEFECDDDGGDSDWIRGERRGRDGVERLSQSLTSEAPILRAHSFNACWLTQPRRGKKAIERASDPPRTGRSKAFRIFLGERQAHHLHHADGPARRHSRAYFVHRKREITCTTLQRR